LPPQRFVSDWPWPRDSHRLDSMNTVQLQSLMTIFSGWVNRSQQDVIEYLREENRVLREQLGGKRLLSTDRKRPRLAPKARAIGRKGFFEISTLVTSDTLLRGYRKLIAKKYDGSQNRRWVAPGQPRRSKSWSCGWPARIRPGVTLGFAAHPTTWGTRPGVQTAYPQRTSESVPGKRKFQVRNGISLSDQLLRGQHRYQEGQGESNGKRLCGEFFTILR
jgi:hypothetical protein